MSITTIHPTKTDTDSALMALSFQAPFLTTGPLVRLVPAAGVEAESLVLGILECTETGHTTVGFTADQPENFLAAAMVADPDNATTALKLVDHLRWTRRYAPIKAGKVKHQNETQAIKLSSTAPQLVPCFLEETARIFAQVGNKQYAKQLFGKARTFERNFNLAIDEARRQAVFTEFLVLDAVSAKEISAEVQRIMDQLEPQVALNQLHDLMLNVAKSGIPAYPNLLNDLKKLSLNAQLDPESEQIRFIAAYLRTNGYNNSPNSSLKKVLPLLKPALQVDPSLADILLTGCPRAWSIDTYVTVLQATGLWTELVADQKQFNEWLFSLFWHPNPRFFTPSNADLLSAIEHNAEYIEGEIPVLRQHFHLDYVEVLLATKATKVGKLFHASTSFLYWLHSGQKELINFRNSAMYQHLLFNLNPRDVLGRINKVLSFESATKLVTEWLESRILNTNSKDYHYYQRIATHLQSVSSTAEIFAAKLRNGTLAEYTWPAFEEVMAAIDPADIIAIIPCFPHIAVVCETSATLIDGTTVLSYDIPAVEKVESVYQLQEHILITYQPKGSYKWMCYWSGDQTVTDYPKQYRHSTTLGDSRIIDDTLQVGSQQLTSGATPTGNLSGSVLGTHPYYTTTGFHDDQITVLPSDTPLTTAEFSASLLSNSLPGLDTSFLNFDFSAANWKLKPNYAFYRPATPSTQDSPFGTHAGMLTGFIFENTAPDSHNRPGRWVSPLGCFETLNVYTSVIRRPGGGFWYLENDLQNNSVHLADHVSGTRIAPSLDSSGAEISLSRLPYLGFHQLSVRNEAASAALRSCSTDQAQELIDDPTKILAFVSGDETLAVAVAGILLEVAMENHALPASQTTNNSQPYLARMLIGFKDTSSAKIIAPPALSLKTTMLLERWSMHVSELGDVFNTALELSNPKPHSRRVNAFANKFDSPVRLIAKEKLVLAKLAAPGIPISVVRELVQLFHWMAEIGLLGKYHRGYFSDDRATLDQRWQQNIAIMQQDWNPDRPEWGSIAIWDPEIVADPCAALNTPKNFVRQDQWFLPKEEFQFHLKATLDWHEENHNNRHAITKQLEKIGSQLASVTPLPPLVWQLLYSGIVTKTAYQTSYDSADCKRVGLTTTQARQARTIVQFVHYDFDQLQAASWHEGFLHDGPSVSAIKAAWQEFCGNFTITICDEDIAALNKLQPAYAPDPQLYFDTDSDLELVNSATRPFHIFTFLMVLTQTAIPKTAQAWNIANRIEQLTILQDPTLTFLSEGHLDDLLEYLKNGTTPLGTPQSPLVTAPETVAQVATELNLSEPAACYFLQLLTLISPTDALVKKWNGWKKQTLDAARSELLARQLVISDKRSGAGRSVFLPGNWLRKTHVAPATEVWKTHHYLWDGARPTIPGSPPLKPFSQLFPEVWHRYRSEKHALHLS